MISIAEVAAQPKPRVIVVEDDASVRRSVQLLLQGRGFDVRAYSGPGPLLADRALDTAACLVADYQLADLDGIALLRKLRQLGWAGPAIMVTAYPSRSLRRTAEEAGFAEFLEKPLTDRSLLRAIARLTGHGQPLD